MGDSDINSSDVDLLFEKMMVLFPEVNKKIELQREIIFKRKKPSSNRVLLTEAQRIERRRAKCRNDYYKKKEEYYARNKKYYILNREKVLAKMRVYNFKHKEERSKRRSELYFLKKQKV